jgi:hypothetical protein
VDIAGVAILERPSTVTVPLLLHQIDGLGDALVGFDAGSPQIVQASQYVIVPASRKRKLRSEDPPVDTGLDLALEEW